MFYIYIQLCRFTIHEVAWQHSSELSLFSCSLTGRQKELDEALVDHTVKDLQPFSIVEDEGFNNFVKKLDPNYVLPSRNTLKSMSKSRYTETKEKAIAPAKKAKAVSLTSDTWTSINMDAYLAVTCHFIDENNKLSTTVPGVIHFPETHTAEHLK